MGRMNNGVAFSILIYAADVATRPLTFGFPLIHFQWEEARCIITSKSKQADCSITLWSAQYKRVGESPLESWACDY